MNKYLLLFIICISLKAAAQNCPPNIGFENGDFTNWECFAGTVAQGTGILNLNTTGSSPTYGRQTMYSKANNPGVDSYGGFPKLCPNGSNYSIQLGNADHPSIAERISYTFVVPPGRSDYTIFYEYAVVLQDPPPNGTPHTTAEKPLFSAEIYDVQSNEYINCASFSFNASSNLPGFSQSPLSNGNGLVYYKGWTPSSINLRGYGGRTVRLEFTARCCVPGLHFGYAYLDVNEGCSSAITGNAYCTGEKSLKLYAPAGFNQYFWYNAADFSKVLGTDYTLTIKPAPANNTTYALKIVPYPGLGCLDTLYTTINAIDAEFSFTAPDSVAICPAVGKVDLTAAAITKGSSHNLTYSYYTDSDAVNYLPSPNNITASGTYYIKAINPSGCTNILPVKVIISNPIVKVTTPAPVTYPASVDLSKAIVQDTSLTYTYYSDAQATKPLTNYFVLHYGGTYYIKATSKYGCSTITAVLVTVYPPPPPVISGPNTFTPNNDGVNDYFKVTITGFGKFKSLQIFNRYGNPVFNTTDITNYWDGTFKGENLPAGTYYWIVTGTNTFDRSTVTQTGYIALVR